LIYLKPKVWVVSLLLLAIVFYGCTNLNPQTNRIDLKLRDLGVNQDPLRVALLSDLHVAYNEKALNDLDELIQSVVLEHPDIIMLAGDYVKNGGSQLTTAEHREAVARSLANTGNIPVVAVLGNHDNWSEPLLWMAQFRGAGITVLENQATIFHGLNLCVRGFGDSFTQQFLYFDFPQVCDRMKKISLTHDPAGAFDERVHGLVLAGHTHCGQLRLPIIGALYVPSSAPREAHCGLYQDAQRQVFVSSGVGTSIIPLRFIAQSQWDLITL
jgi:predicted MPP superfamily phosphohydrolase